MSIIKGIIIAFSTFTKFPMPQFAWKDNDVANMFVGFPLVGIAIAFLNWSLYQGMRALDFPSTVVSIIGFVFIILVTGGIHMDGFMDTMDAIASYKSHKERLEILKDSHVGAFGVIGVLTLSLLHIAGLILLPYEILWIYCGIFVLSRSLSGLACLYLGFQKKEGSLAYFRQTHSRLSLISLWVMFFGVEIFYILNRGYIFVLASLLLILIDFFILRRLCKLFGGMTGDLAGYFLTMNEMLFVWILVLIFRGGLL